MRRKSDGMMEQFELETLDELDRHIAAGDSVVLDDFAPATTTAWSQRTGRCATEQRELLQARNRIVEE